MAEHKNLTVLFGTRSVDEYYPNILYLSNNATEDNILVATTRALINEQRMSKFAVGKVQILVATEIGDKLVSDDDSVAKESINHDGSFVNNMKSGIMVSSIRGKKTDAAYDGLNAHKDWFAEKGWNKIEDVSAFCDPNGGASVYQNIEKQAVWVLVKSGKATTVQHMIAACMPRLFPWAFEGELALTDSEKDLCQAIYSWDVPKVESLFAKEYEKLDIYGKKLQGYFKNFACTNLRARIDHMKNNKQSDERRIQEHLDSIQALYEEVDRLLIEIGFYEARIAHGDKYDNEIIEYLKKNRSIKAIYSSGSEITLYVRCFLSDYDEDMYRSYVTNSTDNLSYVFKYSPWSIDETKEVFDAIWKQHRFKLRTYCGWKIRSDGTVGAIRRFDPTDYDSNETNYDDDRIPQPHIDWYTCYSGYETTFSNLRRQNDFTGILDTIVCSSSSLNWTDSTVVGDMMDWLFNERRDKPVFEGPDGILYTIDGIHDILQKEKEEAAASGGDNAETSPAQVTRRTRRANA